MRVIKIVDELSHQSSPSVIATCNRYTQYTTTVKGYVEVKWKTLEFHRKRFESFHGGDPIKRKGIIYHECGHCYLDWVGHLPRGVYGIMSSNYQFGDIRRSLDFEGLLDDMFSPKFRDMMQQSKIQQNQVKKYFYVNK